MNLRDRIRVLEELKSYIETCPPGMQEAKELANYYNSWFAPEFIDMALQNISEAFLSTTVLEDVAHQYALPMETRPARTVGLVMAGNIPLVGFHDMLCVFLSGHQQVIKLSSRDQHLLPHLVEHMLTSDERVREYIRFADQLKGCDAYIATGSNNTARYFEQYFARYPHIIRKNRTGIAVLDGKETQEELDKLADDIQLYYGLGCRNITQVWVPENFDFVPLLKALGKYDHFMDNHKYKHNYDYVLTISMMNREAYFTNGSVVISPGTSPFAGIANLKYATYADLDTLIASLDPDQIQVIVGHAFKPFGQAQCPGFYDYPDGRDVMQFLAELR